MSTVTSLGFSIYSRYDSSGTRRARQDIEKFKASTTSASKTILKLAAAAPIGAAGIASLAAVAGAGAAAFASATAAVSAFGLAAGPQFKAISEASQKYETVLKAQQKAEVATAQARKLASKGGKEYEAALRKAKSATDAVRTAQGLYRDDLNKMPPATRDTTVALQKLKDAQQTWSDSLAPKTMPIFTKGLDIARSILPQLTPLVVVASDALGSFMDRIAKGVSGPGFGLFIAELTKSAKVVLPAFLDGILNVGQGFVNLIRAFIPHSGAFAKGISNMSQKFLEWTKNLGSSEAFKKFIDFVTENGPRLLKILMDLMSTFGSTAEAVGPMATASTILAEAFANIIAKVPTEVLKMFYIVAISAAVVMQLYAYWTAIAAGATTTLGVAQWWLNDACVGTRIGLAALWIQSKAISVWNGICAASTFLWATAQRALNYAFVTNPIIGIILLIIALGVAVVIAYKKSDTFRAIVQAAWAGIKTAASAVWGFLQMVFRGFMIGLNAVGSTAVGLFHKFHWAWTAIMFIVKIAWWMIRATVAILVAIIRGLAWVVTWLATTVFKVAFAFIMWQVKVLGAIFSWLYNTIGKPIFNGIAWLVKWLWNNVVRPAFSSIVKTVQTVGAIFSWLYNHAIKPYMNQAGSNIRNIWNNWIKPAFNAIKTAVGKVRDAFSTAKDGIKIAWDKLKSAVKGPVKFFVETVYNQGLRAAWNATAGKIPGVPDMEKASLPRGFKKGGPITTGKRGPMDKVPILAQAGEYIIRAKRVREIGRSALDWLNGGSGDQAKNQNGMPGFALGGWVPDTVKKAVGKVTDLAKGGFDWTKGILKSGAASALSTVFKPIRAILNSITNVMPSGGIVGDFIKKFGNAGFDKMIAFVKGKAIDDAGGNGRGGAKAAAALTWARTQVGKAYQWGGNGNPGWDCSGFTSAIESFLRGQKPHRRWSTHAFSGNGAPDGWVRNLRSAYQVGITNAGVGHTAGTLSGVNVETRGGDGTVVGKKARGAMSAMFNSVYGFKPLAYRHGGMIPAQRMDSGGTLPRGLSMVNNTTGAPETLKRKRNGDGDVHYHLHFDRAFVAGSPKAAEDMVVGAMRTAQDNGRIAKGTVKRG